MDLETWLAAPHPPPELLMSIAISGELEDLDSFAAASPEGAAWVAFLMGIAGHFETLLELPEYYDAVVVCTQSETWWMAANESAVNAIFNLHRLDAVKEQRGKVPRDALCDSARETMESLDRLMEYDRKAAEDKIQTCKREEQQARLEWFNSAKRLGALEGRIRNYL